MIYCLVGRPGTGKTYSLVDIAYKAIIHGCNVYSNFYIDFSPLLDKRRVKILRFRRFFNFFRLRLLVSVCDRFLRFGELIFWHELTDFIFIKQGIILMDEAQIYINSREYKVLPTSVQYKFQQHRKHGLDLYLAVQNVKRIDIVARELVNAVFEFKRVGKLFLMREFDIEEIDKTKRTAYRVRFFLFNKKIASCYDTFQEITRGENKIKSLPKT